MGGHSVHKEGDWYIHKVGEGRRSDVIRVWEGGREGGRNTSKSDSQVFRVNPSVPKWLRCIERFQC